MREEPVHSTSQRNVLYWSRIQCVRVLVDGFGRGRGAGKPVGPRDFGGPRTKGMGSEVVGTRSRPGNGETNRRIPTMAALMIKKSVNQTVDIIGFSNSLRVETQPRAVPNAGGAEPYAHRISPTIL